MWLAIVVISTIYTMLFCRHALICMYYTNKFFHVLTVTQIDPYLILRNEIFLKIFLILIWRRWSKGTKFNSAYEPYLYAYSGAYNNCYYKIRIHEVGAVYNLHTLNISKQKKDTGLMCKNSDNSMKTGIGLVTERNKLFDRIVIIA